MIIRYNITLRCKLYIANDGDDEYCARGVEEQRADLELEVAGNCFLMNRQAKFD